MLVAWISLSCSDAMLCLRLCLMAFVVSTQNLQLLFWHACFSGHDVTGLVVMQSFLFSSAVAVGVGGNAIGVYGSARATIARAIPRLIGLLEACVDADPIDIGCSEIVQTSPVGGPPNQEPYANAVVLVRSTRRLATPDAALQLLDQLQLLEAEFGRDRSREQRWGPRTLDLDLLFWGELRLDHSRLVLPHPRMHLRGFVLAPLLDVMHVMGSHGLPDRPEP